MTETAASTEAYLSRFSALQIASFILLGVGGSVIGALDPILLSAMQHDHRLTVPMIGSAATSELLGMAVMAGVAASFFNPVHLKKIAFVTVIIAMCLNGLTTLCDDNGIVLARFLVGCCSGVLMWVFLNMMVRSRYPERLTGIYATALSGSALGLATLCSQLLIPRFGGNGGFFCLVGLNIAMFFATLTLPGRISRLPKSEKRVGVLPWRGIVALVGVGANMGGILGLWVYIVPISALVGQPQKVINIAVTLSILAQFVGGIISAAIGHRMRYYWVLAGSAMTAEIALCVFGLNSNTMIYLIAMAAFGVAWTLAPSYHLLFVVAADPTRRAAMLIATAQLLGCAAGPFLCSVVLTKFDADGALLVSGGMFGLSFVLLLVIQLASRGLRRESLPQLSVVLPQRDQHSGA